jgi:hypothetical protein
MALGLVSAGCIVWFGLSIHEQGRRAEAARSQAEMWFREHALDATSGTALRTACRAWASGLEPDKRDAVGKSVIERANAIISSLAPLDGPFPEPLASEAIAWLDMGGSFSPCLLEQACDLRVERARRAGRTPTGAELRECIVAIREAMDGCRSERIRKSLVAKEVELEAAIDARDSALVEVTQ